MVKQFFYVFVLCMAIQTVAAQNEPAWNLIPTFEKGYIHLKDGRIIHGQYLYSAQLDKIRIIQDNTSFVMDASAVLKITKKKPRPDKEEKKNDYVPKVKNYFILSELGMLLGNPDNTIKNPVVFHASINRKLTGKTAAGVGVGVEFYKETYLPVTINGFYRFSKDPFTPFAMVQTGYLIPIEGSRTKVQSVMPENVNYIWPGPIVSYDTELKAKGGILLNPSLGVMWFNRSNVGFSFSAGYRFHRLRYNNKEKEYNLNVDYNRLSLKMGILF